ncbi:hypothetical protein JHK85_019264 [Glycine max]|nr:hypothetical protein JHK85_019264 [Glycine max]
MALQPKIIACGNSVATFAMAIRFLTGPAVMAAASIAVGLRGTLLHVAIVQAALPQGIVPFVFAKEYNVHPAILSTAGCHYKHHQTRPIVVSKTHSISTSSKRPSLTSDLVYLCLGELPSFQVACFAINGHEKAEGREDRYDLWRECAQAHKDYEDA